MLSISEKLTLKIFENKSTSVGADSTYYRVQVKEPSFGASILIENSLTGSLKGTCLLRQNSCVASQRIS